MRRLLFRVETDKRTEYRTIYARTEEKAIEQLKEQFGEESEITFVKELFK